MDKTERRLALLRAASPATTSLGQWTPRKTRENATATANTAALDGAALLRKEEDRQKGA